MSLNVTLCHPEAESLVDLAAAEGYLAAHPDRAAWDGVPGDTDEEKQAAKEALLVAATRMISRAPLRERPLSEALGWSPPQELGVPTEGHSVIYGVADGGGGAILTDASIATLTEEEIAGGSIRFVSGELILIEEFDPATGAMTLAQTPATPIEVGTPFAIVGALPRNVRAAVCEQAAYLATNPSLAVLQTAARGVSSVESTGSPGAGAVRVKRAPETAELCFAARRLLIRSGLLAGPRGAIAERA